MIPKDNVFFRLEGHTHFVEGCGHWTDQQIINFVAELESNKIPYDCCLWKIDVKHNYTTSLCKSPLYPPEKRHTLDITIDSMPAPDIRPCGTKKYADTCFYKIALGECKDPWVVKNIGAKLFAVRYSK